MSPRIAALECVEEAVLDPENAAVADAVWPPKFPVPDALPVANSEAHPAIPADRTPASVPLAVAQQALHADPTERRVGQKQASSVQLEIAASICWQGVTQGPTAKSTVVEVATAV